jgi:hypothetical protein
MFGCWYALAMSSSDPFSLAIRSASWKAGVEASEKSVATRMR